MCESSDGHFILTEKKIMSDHQINSEQLISDDSSGLHDVHHHILESVHVEMLAIADNDIGRGRLLPITDVMAENFGALSTPKN